MVNKPKVICLNEKENSVNWVINRILEERDTIKEISVVWVDKEDRLSWCRSEMNLIEHLGILDYLKEKLLSCFRS